MSSAPPLSRSYLQGIPEKRKQQRIDEFIQGFINELLKVAEAGKTSYMYSLDNRHGAAHCGGGPQPPVITNDELVSAFQKKFPECDVSYQEKWVDVTPHNMILKKGIVIDWS
jgi:hypothetical protein